jgi:LytS/YehU family sensor histidine kinase
LVSIISIAAKKETYRKTVEQVNNKALRAQMNPHFIFNSLNSIQDFINNNDLPNANTYIVKFAKLISTHTRKQPTSGSFYWLMI